MEELNIKAKNWTDLLTGESFVRKDIIVLQDPGKLDKFNISNFYHIQKNVKVDTEGTIGYLFFISALSGVFTSVIRVSPKQF